MPLPSTQNYIDIAGIKDGIVIMKNGQYRIILQVTSINFQLKSDDEKNAIIFQFQNFLNSLHFPIQITVRSKRVELAPYLERMMKLAEKQTNPLLRDQTLEYVTFVGKLVEVANIMKKVFYVVIGQDALISKKTGLFGNLFNKQTAETLKIAEEEYKRKIDELNGKANSVINGLSGMGLRAKQLTTEEIINFFYQSYNPDLAENERLQDIDNSLLGGGSQGNNAISPNEEKVDPTASSNNLPLAAPPVIVPNNQQVPTQQKVPAVTNIPLSAPQTTSSNPTNPSQQMAPNPLGNQAVPNPSAKAPADQTQPPIINNQAQNN